MNGNTTRGHFPAPSSHWSFTCFGGLALLAPRCWRRAARLYQNCLEGQSRRSLWTILRVGFPKVLVESWEELLLWHLSEAPNSS